MTRLAALLAVVLAVVLASVGCTAQELEDHPCPPGGTTLTYANFGEPFFAEHCVRCHGGPTGYSSRAFNTLAGIRANRERIFVTAANDNTSMPPGPDDPPEDQRRKLADWLACGTPP